MIALIFELLSQSSDQFWEMVAEQSTKTDLINSQNLDEWDNKDAYCDIVQKLQLTCKIASLCISWSLQAGIMFLSTPNSSFIFDRRLLSITLCAVFLAIFLPAWLVELGCLFGADLRAAEGSRGALQRGFVFGVSFTASALGCSFGVI